MRFFFLVSVAIGAFLALCASSGVKYPHTDPENQGGWIPYEALTDEFEGTKEELLNKWLIGTRIVGWDGRVPLYQNDPSSVAVEDGHLVLTLKKLGQGSGAPAEFNYSMGWIVSKARRRYGYFEARLWPANASLTSDFFMIGRSPTFAQEVNIYETPAFDVGKTMRVGMNRHIFRSPAEDGVNYTQLHQNTLASDVNFTTGDGFHTYALEWNEDQMMFWADGQLLRNVSTSVWKLGMFILFGGDLNFYRYAGVVDSSRVPATMRVDYVRAWTKPDIKRTIYVDGAIGDDSNSGLSWRSPLRTILAAIDASVDGNQILVAEGTYSGYINLHGVRNIHLFGGFRSGGGWGERDPERYPSVIVSPPDGFGTVDIRGVEGVVMNGFTITGTSRPFGHAITLIGPYKDTGFVNCKVVDNVVPKGAAPALSIGDSASSGPVFFRKTKFTGNRMRSGFGGCASFSSVPYSPVNHPEAIFHECDFSGNTAATSGSAFYSDLEQGWLSMKNCLIESSHLSEKEVGAAVVMNGGQLRVRNTRFVGNEGNALQIGPGLEKMRIFGSSFVQSSGYGLWIDWDKVNEKGRMQQCLFAQNNKGNVYIRGKGKFNAAKVIDSLPFANGTSTGKDKGASETPVPSKGPSSTPTPVTSSPLPPTTTTATPSPLADILWTIQNWWRDSEGFIGFIAHGVLPGGHPGEEVRFDWSSPTEVVNMWGCRDSLETTDKTLVCDLIDLNTFGMQGKVLDPSQTEPSRPL